MAELRCEGVAKSYGDRSVLSDVDLVVPEGTVTAILGSSGSGKTTLLRVIIGFVAADRGRILVDGVVVADAQSVHLQPERRSIGYVAQEGALYPHLGVGENVGFGLPRSERKTATRIGEVLELVGLHADDARRRPHELSGGEQRRVALARALAPRPSLVLLDEPFSGLDASLRVETREAVLKALRDAGTTAVLVTHDQAEALSMGREVAVLRDGRLVQTAVPSALYREPADLEVARFVGEAVVLPGVVEAGTVRCALGDLLVLGSCADGPVATVIRPEQIELRLLSALAAPPDRAVAATVTGGTYFGPDTVVRLVLDGADGTEVTARVFSHEAPADGDRVQVVVAGAVVVYQARPGGGVDAGAT